MQSYYPCTASKWHPSGSPYKIYISNVTFNDERGTKDEGCMHAAGRFKGIISYICAFPEVIIEWQGLQGNLFLSSKRMVRRKMFLYWKHVMTARKWEHYSNNTPSYILWILWTQSKLSCTIHFCKLDFKIKDRLSHYKERKQRVFNFITAWHVLNKRRGKSILLSPKPQCWFHTLLFDVKCLVLNLGCNLRWTSSAKPHKPAHQICARLCSVSHAWLEWLFQHRAAGQRGGLQHLQLWPLEIWVSVLIPTASECDLIWNRVSTEVMKVKWGNSSGP